jgi:Fe-S oxidoreductase
MVEALRPYAERKVPIVGVEPSCLLTLRDELPALFPDNSTVRQIADSAVLFEEFIAQQALHPTPSISGKAIVHSHCHTKALVGMNPLLDVLGRCARLEVAAPDTGCCGMAGAFGYGADRFAISRMIGERVLLPTINAAAPDTLIIADGFACRSQIRQFCPDRQPLHPAQILNLAFNHRPVG